MENFHNVILIGRNGYAQNFQSMRKVLLLRTQASAVEITHLY